MTSETPVRGRPRLAEVVEVRTRAIDLLLAEGYGAVTMSDIAAATGLSVRTLHRYFPTKADIVWGGLDGALESFRRALATADRSLGVVDAVARAMEEVLGEEADPLTFGPARLRLIATTPEFEFLRPGTYRRWGEEIIAFIAERTGADADGLVTRATGAAIHGALSEALSWWATHDGDLTPAEAVAHALAGFGVADHP